MELSPGPEIRITENTLLSDNWFFLRKYTFDIEFPNREIETHKREVYDRGDGATILLYNKTQSTVILTRQFRIATYVSGHSSGMMIEACAGMLDENNPEDCIKKETKEETGYHISKIEKIYEAYTTPGANTEIIHFFIGAYTKDMKLSEGGGLQEEQEYIEVLELDFDEAYDMIASGEIKDAKTIMLLQYIKLNNIL